MTPRILVFASINLDLTLNLERQPALGETLLVADSLSCPGGKGANQGIAAKRLGAHVGIVCCVGDDLPGEAVRHAVEAEGLEIVGWHTDPHHHTGVASISVFPDAQNAIVVATGANRGMTPAHVDEAFARGDQWDFVLTTMETPYEVARQIAKHTHGSECAFMLDAGGNPQSLRDGDLSGIDVLTANETETEIITGRAVPNSQTALEVTRMLWQQRCDPEAFILLKRGEEGSLLINPLGATSVPAFHVNTTSTVAAGDAHSAAFAVACAEGMTMEDTLHFANAAGALACTKPGAFPAMPTRDEVDRFLQAL